MARVMPMARAGARVKKTHADQKVKVAPEEAKGAEPLAKRINADPLTRPKAMKKVRKGK